MNDPSFLGFILWALSTILAATGLNIIISERCLGLTKSQTNWFLFGFFFVAAGIILSSVG